MIESDAKTLAAQLERRNKEIEIIERVASQISKTLNLDAIAKTMLISMEEYFGFKHSMILLLDGSESVLKVIATHGYEEEGIGAEVKIGVGVIGMVAKKKKLMRMANLGAQKQYMQAIKQQIQPSEETAVVDVTSLPGLKNAESQVAIPMLMEDELIGVFSVESDQVNIFDKSDELIIKILANQTANALQNAKLYQLEQQRLQELDKAHAELADLNTNLERKVADRTKELVDLSEKLAKYFSPQVYDSIFSGELDVKIQTQRKPLTVFFCDLQGFTQLTERLEPEILTELLTQYLTEMSKIAIRWGGTIDKFIGDAILVFFGDPESRGNKEDAMACVSMALEMLEKLELLREAWRERGLARSLNARMGVHSGVCTVGNFGSEDRLDYTVIGNGVNLAARLEANSESNKILISEDTYLLVKEEIKCIKKQEISVKGISYPIQTYEVSGFTSSSSSYSSKLVKSIPGLSLTFDPNEIEDNERAMKLISDVLSRLV
ncbi:GAF domain-containing protein [Paracoccaceae bacterium]|nr:GAF domain-containing protein [Paracoccaceae bacterium]